MKRGSGEIRKLQQEQRQENAPRCPDGFRGASCEESCTLPCQNGGQCTFEDNHSNQEDSSSSSSSSPWSQAVDGMFCSCPSGFVGLHCEYEAQTCGFNDELVCLNGSTCIQDKRHAGGYRCEHPDQITRCNPSDKQVEFYNGMAVAAFCVNGGKCRERVIDNEL